MGRLIYKELAKGQIKQSRNVVISEATNTEGDFVGYSVAQQLVTKEPDGKETKVFLKDSGMGVIPVEGLINLYNACEEALTKLSEQGVVVFEDECEKGIDTDTEMC